MTPQTGDRRQGRASSGPRRPWALVIALMAIYTYAFVDRVALALLVDPIRAELHIDDVQISLLLGLAFAGFYAVMNFPAGYVVDKFNRRALIGLASISWAAMTLCCALARDFNQLFLARAGVGLAEAVMAPAAFSLIRDAVPERSRGLAFSIYGTAPMLGGFLALTAGGLLLHAAGAGAFRGLFLLSGLSAWRIVLALIGVTGLPISLLLLLFREPEREIRPDGGVAMADRGAGATYRHVRDKAGAYLALGTFATFGAMMAFGQSAWLPAMLSRRWLVAPDRIGPILGLMTLAGGLVGLSLSGYILNTLLARGRDICLFGALAALGTAGGLAGAALAPSFPAALVCAGLGMVCVGVSFPVGATTLAQITPSRFMGRVAGVYLLFQTLLGQALGPTLIALASQRLFHGPKALPDAFAIMMGLFGAITIIAALMLRSKVWAPQAASRRAGSDLALAADPPRL